MIDNHDAGTVVADLLTDEGLAKAIEGRPDLSRRILKPTSGVTIVSDHLGVSVPEIRYARIRGGRGPRRVVLAFGSGIDRAVSLRHGWLLRVCGNGRDATLWLPRTPILAQFDRHGRVQRTAGTATIELTTDDGQTRLSVTTDCESEHDLCLAAVVVEGQHEAFEEEVRVLCRVEHEPIIKSDWFSARSPLELWNSLIDGELFDPRPSRRGGRRFPCQQCAFAWWSYLQALWEQTGRGILRILAREVAWSARARLLENGEWTHGFWCDPPETHLRFVFDGLQLLMSEGEASGEAGWIDDAGSAMESVIENSTDTLEGNGLWFLHDSLELDASAARTESGALGSTSGNTLCLNTHVQALTVLDQLRRRTAGRRSGNFEDAYQRGMNALKKILMLRPADGLYRVIGSCVVPAVTAKGASGPSARLRRILFFRVLRWWYWRARRAYPRLVYPNGFIERDMSSSMLADDYHILNLKDLLTLYQKDPQPWLDSIIGGGVRFASRLDLEAALTRSPLFIEYADVLRLHGRLFEGDDPQAVERVDRAILDHRHGHSLDSWVSESIRPDEAAIPGLKNAHRE